MDPRSRALSFYSQLQNEDPELDPSFSLNEPDMRFSEAEANAPDMKFSEAEALGSPHLVGDGAEVLQVQHRPAPDYTAGAKPSYSFPSPLTVEGQLGTDGSQFDNVIGELAAPTAVAQMRDREVPGVSPAPASAPAKGGFDVGMLLSGMADGISRSGAAATGRSSDSDAMGDLIKLREAKRLREENAPKVAYEQAQYGADNPRARAVRAYLESKGVKIPDGMALGDMNAFADDELTALREKAKSESITAANDADNAALLEKQRIANEGRVAAIKAKRGSGGGGGKAAGKDAQIDWIVTHFPKLHTKESLAGQEPKEVAKTYQNLQALAAKEGSELNPTINSTIKTVKDDLAPIENIATALSGIESIMKSNPKAVKGATGLGSLVPSAGLTIAQMMGSKSAEDAANLRRNLLMLRQQYRNAITGKGVNKEEILEVNRVLANENGATVADLMNAIATMRRHITQARKMAIAGVPGEVASRIVKDMGWKDADIGKQVGAAASPASSDGKIKLRSLLPADNNQTFKATPERAKELIKSGKAEAI